MKVVVFSDAHGNQRIVERILDVNREADYFISLGLADDDEQKDNLAIDRRYDLIHLQVRAERRDFGISALNMAMSIDQARDML